MMSKMMSVWMLGLVLVLGAGAMAQDAEGEQRGQREGERRQRVNFRDMTPEQREAMMKQFRERREQAMRERLEASEEEWKIISPRLNRLTQLRTQGMRSRYMAFAGRGRGGSGNNRSERPEREMSDIAKKSMALREALEKKADASTLKKAIEELRAARKAREDEIDKARKELREVLTLRQEAMLVAMGTLE